MQYTHQNRRAPCHPAGESRKSPLRVDFDRRLKLEFHGSKITSDAGLLTYRELDDALGLTEVAGTIFQDSRTGKNGWHGMTAQFRQSVFGRLGGYEDVNDADRLGRDPAMRWIVGGKAVERQAASSSQMGRFETALLATDANIEALADMNGVWIDRVHDRRPPKMLILDMDSSVSPTHGEQEGAAYNGHFGCTCYHPLFLFNQFGDLERCSLRPGKYAIKWTRLSCGKFRNNEVRLQLHALAYNLGNFMRTLALPKEVEHWSLTTLREKLVKIGAKVVRHGRYVTFQLAEVAVPRSLFQQILELINDLRPRPVPA